MTASRVGLAVALILAGCATATTRQRATSLPPPAHQSRAGALPQSAGPAPVQPPAAPGNASIPEAGSAGAETKPSRAVMQALDTATALIGSRSVVVDGVDYGTDCAALVRAAFARAGRPLPATARSVRSVLEIADGRGALRQTRRPSPGDLVFLADTPGGPAVHVALVARTEPDGTAIVLHRVSRGVRRVRMNLAQPERTTDPTTGKHINDLLRIHARQEPAGRLVVGVSDLLRRS